MLKTVIKRYIDIVATKRCELCGKVIEFNKTICDECATAPLIKSERCRFCGYSKDDCLCNKHKNEYKEIIGVYYYDKSIPSAVYNFKDNDMPFLAKRFAYDIFKTVEECCSDISFDFVTFVPLRRFKKFHRGFNQSQLIAKELAKHLNLPCVDCLEKTRYTGVQHYKTASQRRADAFGSYDVKEKYRDYISGKTILIIDDVKTTGATLNECSKMLNIYEADSVYAATLAITKKEKHNNS